MDCLSCSTFRCPVSLTSANPKPWQRFSLGRCSSPRKLSSSSHLGGAAPQLLRCAAIHIPQDWLTVRREDELGFGQQKLVQASAQSKGVSSVVLQAAYKSIFIGLRMTALVFQLVHSIVADIRRGLWWQERSARARAELAARQRQAEEERLLALRREEERRLRSEANDAQFFSMLHTMGDPNIPLETKWEAIATQVGSKDEFRQPLTRLFKLAGESSKAVLESGSNLTAFWKSEHTQSVIAQEEALKRQLYLQLLHGSGAA